MPRGTAMRADVGRPGLEGAARALNVAHEQDVQVARLTADAVVPRRLDALEPKLTTGVERNPGFLERQASSGGTPTYRRPCCVGDIRVKDMGPVNEDIDNILFEGINDAVKNSKRMHLSYRY